MNLFISIIFDVSIIYDLFAHKSGTPSRGFSQQQVALWDLDLEFMNQTGFEYLMVFPCVYA